MQSSWRQAWRERVTPPQEFGGFGRAESTRAPIRAAPPPCLRSTLVLTFAGCRVPLLSDLLFTRLCLSWVSDSEACKLIAQNARIFPRLGFLDLGADAPRVFGKPGACGCTGMEP